MMNVIELVRDGESWSWRATVLDVLTWTDCDEWAITGPGLTFSAAEGATCKLDAFTLPLTLGLFDPS